MSLVTIDCDLQYGPPSSKKIGGDRRLLAFMTAFSVNLLH